jgi:L,D-transpeptidase ErfK/SrfK
MRLVTIIFMNAWIFLIIYTTLFFTAPVAAEVYSFDNDNTVIGINKTYSIKNDESLIEIARKFGLGYNEIVNANPNLDPFVPGTNMPVKIPASWVLPDVASYNGIVINLSEMRLYYFFRKLGSTLVRTFPIGIGSEGTDTPVGDFRVIEKMERPSWNVPESIREKNPKLPKVVPPGPNNPLGSHALRLSSPSILIHGTNKPYGIGRRVSHGCIRLYPEDISKLFWLVPNGAKVAIVRQPIKVGVKNNKIYIEVHMDKYLKINYFNEAAGLLRKKKLFEYISREKFISALREKSGIPVEISN